MSAERAAQLSQDFQNKELRAVQLEYVFSKCYHTEEGRELRGDQTYMIEVERLKALYKGEQGAGGLALCHGDCHAGSVMVDALKGSVKIIDPEFAVVRS